MWRPGRAVKWSSRRRKAAFGIYSREKMVFASFLQKRRILLFLKKK
jgi:hypothetical protein